MKNITLKEYCVEIKALAQSILDEYEGEEAQNDAVREVVDSHQWIIYFAYHFDVLQHCSNENAYFDMFGECPLGKCISDITMQLAFTAMEADVRTALTERRAEIEDES